MRPTLWSSPARWPTWLLSATKSSTIRATSTTKKTLPQTWASAKARYENDRTDTLMGKKYLNLCIYLNVWQSVYKWRIDLSKSEKYWDGWFRGTSNLFLACNLPKLLLLAGGYLKTLISKILLWKLFLMLMVRSKVLFCASINFVIYLTVE